MRALAYDATHDVTYLGIGPNTSVIQFDNVTGDKNDILPAAYANISLPSTIDYTGDRVFVGSGGVMIILKVTENPDGTFNSVTTDATSTATSPVSPAQGGKVYWASQSSLFEYDIAAKTTTNLNKVVDGRVKRFGWVTLSDQTNYPGETLVGIVQNNNQTYIMKYNPQNGAYRFVQVSGAAKIPGAINMIGSAPDGNIYTGAYLTGGIGVYKPIRGDGNDGTEELMYSPISQTDKMAAYNGKMYFGVYPGGNLWEYEKCMEARPFGEDTPRLRRAQQRPNCSFMTPLPDWIRRSTYRLLT